MYGRVFEYAVVRGVDGQEGKSVWGQETAERRTGQVVQNGWMIALVPDWERRPLLE